MKWWALVVAAGAVALSVVVTLLVRDFDSGAPSAGAEPSAVRSGPTVHPRASIELESPSYFGRPFETIRLAGRYRGVRTPRTLHLQIRQDAGWARLPLPAVTAPSGRFRAYVELGTGRYLVRLVDPARGNASKAVPLMVF